ncbi:hypothetical protein FOT62_22735 [Serratia marcescens]|uniref:Uncharacterized protein n=1 Tax=Serratia marcescens TaxID=615 RepID=A0A5C7BS36_SERMA|nr:MULTISPECIES: hypothetical protein [Serratia]TXE27139.1 hypothetical protein FOT62_22735 [Serratia marcescens]TXE55304.1 hypothetical protein FOT56_25430 [Serratia marcescens]
MANQIIDLAPDMAVRADQITKVWVSNNGDVLIKLREGTTHSVEQQCGETPYQTSCRIKAQIEAALAERKNPL